MFYVLYLTDPPPSLSLSGDTSTDDTTNNDNNGNDDLDNNNAINNNDDDKVDENKPPNMAKSAAAKKNKSIATAPKKASAKTTGEDVTNIDNPPRKKQRAADQAGAYSSTKTLKGYTVNQYSKGSKNRINVVFLEGGVPSERAQPVMSLDQGGKALQVKWKLSESLFTDEQVMEQLIPKDSARYTGYADTLDRIHQAGVAPINKFYPGAPQVIALNWECTGNPVTNRWCVLTNEVVHYDGRDHIQFNSMYVTTLKVAKDCHTLISGPKFAGIAKFGDVGSLKRDGSGGGGGRGKCGRGGWCPPPPEVKDNDLSSSDNKE